MIHGRGFHTSTMPTMKEVSRTIELFFSITEIHGRLKRKLRTVVARCFELMSNPEPCVSTSMSTWANLPGPWDRLSGSETATIISTLAGHLTALAAHLN